MVENTRTPKSSNIIRSLKPPIPIEVEENESRSPINIIIHGQKSCSSMITDMWAIEDEWWKDTPISRKYYRIILKTSTPITIFHNLVDGCWYYQQT